MRLMTPQSSYATTLMGLVRNHEELAKAQRMTGAAIVSALRVWWHSAQRLYIDGAPHPAPAPQRHGRRDERSGLAAGPRAQVPCTRVGQPVPRRSPRTPGYG